MRITILGSTGFVGKVLLWKSIDLGHQIKVLVRNPDKLGKLSGLVEVVKGDYFDREKLENAIAGSELVISAIGPPYKNPGRYNSFEDAMFSLVSIMMEQDMKRIIIIGGAVTPVFDDEVFNFRQKYLSFILKLVGKHMIEIKKKECVVLAQSGLDWTIVRPPRVTKGAPLGRVIANENYLNRLEIDVEDLADFILGQINSGEWIHKAPLVSK